jgi:hypothetical protein
MSAIIFVAAPKPLKLSAYFLAGVAIAVTVGVAITHAFARACSVTVSRLATPRTTDRSATSSGIRWSGCSYSCPSTEHDTRGERAHRCPLGAAHYT